MLIGYDKRETWERLLYRFRRMAERYIKVYPMVYGDKKRSIPLGDLKPVEIRRVRSSALPIIANPSDPRLQQRTLGQFQRYVIKRYYTVCPFEDFQITEWQKSQAIPVEPLDEADDLQSSLILAGGSGHGLTQSDAA